MFAKSFRQTRLLQCLAHIGNVGAVRFFVKTAFVVKRAQQLRFAVKVVVKTEPYRRGVIVDYFHCRADVTVTDDVATVGKLVQIGHYFGNCRAVHQFVYVGFAPRKFRRVNGNFGVEVGKPLLGDTSPVNLDRAHGKKLVLGHFKARTVDVKHDKLFVGNWRLTRKLLRK